jgi:hypothetical protein
MITLATSTIEDFEADLVRQLGLTTSIEDLRRIGNSSRRQQSAKAAASNQQSQQVPPLRATDFEARYKACQTTAERREFVRAHVTEARGYLRAHRGVELSAPARTPTASASVTRPGAKLIRRKLK